jgi:hypothetical protein
MTHLHRVASTDSPMWRLVYASTSLIDAGPGAFRAEISDILASSARNNRLLTLTGVLVHNGSRFMQLLEGPRESVHFVMELIRADARHESIAVLIDERAETRVLPDWAMAFLTSGDKDLSHLSPDRLETRPSAEILEGLVTLSEKCSEISVPLEPPRSV